MAIDAALGRLGNKSGVCTSSTRPVNPFHGQVIFETDTNRTLVYDNSAWLVVADNQVLSIDAANGRVGIGVVSPSQVLDVSGSIKASANAEFDHINVGAGVGDGDLGEDIRVGGIRGAFTSANAGNDQLIHLYNNVNIGFPTGWGGQDAPIYGLHVYGAITTSTHPLFIAAPSGGQQDLGTLAKVNYQTEVIDRGNNYDTSLSRFTAPITGVYLFNHRWWALVGTAGTAYTYLYKNGSVLVEMRNHEPTTTTEYETICSTYTVALNANDYVEIYASSPQGRFHRSSAYRYAEFSGYLLG